MDWKVKYNSWRNFSGLDGSLSKQLKKVEKNPEQLEDSFYKYLEFGTGGMRGIIGPGPNRMNIYTVRRAAEGLARFIVENGEEAKKRGVVIAYDSRHKSNEFALEAAKTLGYHGIKTYVFTTLRTTPELSFAVRYLKAYSGIVITASHNPAEYSGFKLYGQDGAQFVSERGSIIAFKVDEIDNELTIKVGNEEELKKTGLITMIGDTVDQAYLKQLESITVNPNIIKQVADDFVIVYTPLHGTGNRPVRKALANLGFKHVQVVEEQEQPDSDFSTVKSPNPEDPAAFELAIEYGKKHNADILLATDPDTDRAGVAVKKRTGKYYLLNGNQIGVLLLHYLITQKVKKGELTKNATVLKTIVTSELGRDIAKAHGLKTIDTLTGFKYISEKIEEFEDSVKNDFLFGYEESYGYLIGDFVRDKDAVQTCLLLAEVASYYKTKNLNLLDGLYEIYKEYGYYKEGLQSLKMEGKTGVKQINNIMESFRKSPPLEVADRQVFEREDYLINERILVNEHRRERITLPKSNVLKYKLEGNAWFCIRPSGTEPKIKFYYGVKEDTLNESEIQLLELEESLLEKVNNLKV